MVGRNRFLACTLLSLVSIVSACSVRPVYDSGPAEGKTGFPPIPADDPVPRDEPKARFGNGPYYEVHGKIYKVLDTNYGYVERGVASWYGRKFHGKPTSSQERYDMYAMTAAHRSLPLPSYARVRNLANGRSVIVRINDRGPFVENRLIDLSYAAAVKLDMIKTGTSLVEVTAISFDEPPPQVAHSIEAPIEVPAENVFVQVGAFGEPENARRRFALLRDVGIEQAFVHLDDSTTPALYRVRIGPIADVLQYDLIVQQLQNLGILETHLVTD